MIDLHSHILYGLDDGPETLEESLAMCRLGYRDGIRTIVATPHTLNGVYRNSRTAIVTRVRELNAALKKFEIGNSIPNPQSPLRILPGADVHLGEEILRHLREDRLMTLGDAHRFILIELPSQGVPYLAEKVLFQLLGRGIIPVITHPERNPEIGRKPARYYEMIRMGCLGQVTAMSLTGGFGPGVRRFAEELLTHRLVHIIASDAHSIEERPPILTPSVRVASKLVGEDEARRMVTEYPQAVLEGRRPEIPPPLPI